MTMTAPWLIVSSIPTPVHSFVEVMTKVTVVTCHTRDISD
jgi:hypothetical protein